MFNKLFRKKPFQNVPIQRFKNEPHGFFGKKLAGRHFDYDDGDGEANLFQSEDGMLYIELRVTDSQDNMHVLLPFKSPKQANEFIEWMMKDIEETKALLRSSLQ